MRHLAASTGGARRAVGLITGSLSLLVGLVVLPPDCFGQPAPNWRLYKLADGLPESGCISVTFSPQGKVLARHFNLPLVSELDGYSVHVLQSPALGKSRVYQSPAGQLWTVSPEGLAEYREGKWVFDHVPEAAGPHSGFGRVVDPIPLYPVRQGLVLLLLPDKLLEYNCETADHPRTRVLREAGQTALESFTGMTASRDGGLWISGSRGLAKLPGPLRTLKPETAWREFVLPAGLLVTNLQSPHVLSDAQTEAGFRVVAIAESSTNQQKLIVTFDGQNWAAGPPGEQRLRQAWCSSDQRCWAMTIDSLLQWDLSNLEPSECEEVSARQYLDLAVEPGGAFWLATSDGLWRYAPPLWSAPASVRKITSPIRCLAAGGEGRLWFVTGNRLCSLQDEQVETYPLPGLRRRALHVRGLFLLDDDCLVVDVADSESTGGGWLFRFDPATRKFSPISPPNPGGRFKALGLLRDGTLCVQSHSGETWSLQRCNGRELESLPEMPPVQSLSNELCAVYVAQNGDLWLSSEQGTACLHEKKWKVFTSNDRTTPSSAFFFAELPDGKLWCATRDQVWEFDGQSWWVKRGGFDQISALLRARDGSIWIASNTGLHRFAKAAWVENGTEDGLPSAAVRGLCEQGDRLWAATTRGLSLFHPNADPDPPQTLIRKMTDYGDNAELGAVSLLFGGMDKWKYTRAERLLFSYRLDDGEWTTFQEGDRALFTELRAGKHYFQVRAMDRNCNQDPKPAQLEFAILLPWYKDTRLVLIAMLGAAAALISGIIAVNRHRRLVRSYAEIELKVAERTRQLEVASRELVHSQKMKALGTLAAGIAHDFNNILSIIKGSAQVIEDNLNNPEKIRTRTDRIGTVVEQGAGIVKAMLGFSRESGQLPAVCDLNTVAKETLTLLGDRFLREVQVEFQPSPALPPVQISKDLVQQILLNFIFNAAESMTGRKRIVLATGLCEKLPPEMVLAPLHAPRYATISVRDFGCGIAPENVQRIFEPFFTTKAMSTHRGTGLGLSMAYELAKKLGAGLGVDSALNAGSTFVLILPVRDLPPEPEP